jgi:hypothetical protein
VLGEHHRACAAIAFGAAFLAADEMPAVAQPLKERGLGRNVPDVDQVAVDKEAEAVRHGLRKMGASRHGNAQGDDGGIGGDPGCGQDGT